MRWLRGSRRRLLFVPVVLFALVAAGWLVWVGGGEDGGRDDASPTVSDPAESAGPTDGERWAECRESARDVEPRDTEDVEESAAEPKPGASGMGDPYFPDLGNGGYDVLHYELDLQWDPATDHLAGTVTIDAVAVQALSSFNLDLIGMEVTDVVVDGRPAEADREGGRELVITPAGPLGLEEDFQVEITYEGVPEPVEGLFPNLGGWESHDGEVFVAAQPDGAATFYPVNDHPADKACYTFRITAPDDLVAVANGIPAGPAEESGEGLRTWTYESFQPMASYLVQVAIANFVIEEDVSPKGVPIRHAIDSDVYDQGIRAMEPTGEMIDYYAEIFGPYPFDSYGGVVVDDPIRFALETQTLSLFPAHVTEPTVAHEAVHQWLGNWVSPATWQDVWLNEGFATYFTWAWEEHTGGRPIDQIAEQESRAPGLDLPPADPGPENLLDRTVYVRGALTLIALRHEVGEAAFSEIVRSWVDLYGGTSASTADFEGLAAEIAGSDLTPLFDVWLRSDELPDLDDWVN